MKSTLLSAITAKLFARSFTGLLLLQLLVIGPLSAQHSVARKWNEVLLQSIREDLARPTVHARNLFHTSAAMYDSWAAYDEVAIPYFLGREVGGHWTAFDGIAAPDDVEAAREETLSYAVYRLLRHRFQFSPSAFRSGERMDSLLNALGYDKTFESTDYSNGSPAALGNYIAENIIAYGLQDGSNEELLYFNLYYQPSNEALEVAKPGNPTLRNQCFGQFFHGKHGLGFRV